jgi:hypothetical protein
MIKEEFHSDIIFAATIGAVLFIIFLIIFTVRKKYSKIPEPIVSKKRPISYISKTTGSNKISKF